jgi:hypothetical protein
MAQNRGTKAPERLNVVKLRASRTQLSASQLRDHANLRLQLDQFKRNSIALGDCCVGRKLIGARRSGKSAF